MKKRGKLFAKHTGCTQIVRIAAALLLCLTLLSSNAQAAETVTVGQGICSPLYFTDEPFGYFGFAGSAPPLLLKLPEGHCGVTLTIGAVHSWAATEDMSAAINPQSYALPSYVNFENIFTTLSNLVSIANIVSVTDINTGLEHLPYPPGIIPNKYSIQIRDWNNCALDVPVLSIPNGGSIRIKLGPEVGAIAVRSNYNLGHLESIRSKIPGQVYYESVEVTYPVYQAPNSGTINQMKLSIQSSQPNQSAASTVEYVERYYQHPNSRYIRGQYTGQWQNDAPNGNGRLIYDRSDPNSVFKICGLYEAISYEGEFRDGWRYGEGVVTYENGYSEVGTFYGPWKAGKVVFEGKIWLNDGTYYGYWPAVITAIDTENAEIVTGEWHSMK